VTHRAHYGKGDSYTAIDH